MTARSAYTLAAGAILLAGGVAAQEADEGVVVSATRSERRSFDVPVSIDAVGAEALREGQPKVDLSESLGRVPGLAIQNRHNYAQDLQLSIRGFGARATFGIRGVKLYADGIPATMPDGQGQAANFNLSSAQRVEVMRGPIANLYGNAAGGVIQLFTQDGPKQPTVTGEAMAGSYGTWRIGAQAGGQTAGTSGKGAGALNYLGDWSRFHTDGYRAHSSAEREQFNGKLKWNAPRNEGDTPLSLVANTLYQPETQDPLGLTRAQVAADPRQADATASLFNTRKTIRQAQSGVVAEHSLGGGDLLRASVFLGERAVRQYLAMTGAAITQSGGVVDLESNFGGFGLTWIHTGEWLGRALALTAGAEQETLQQRRRGYVNNFGSMGDLRRDEDDSVTGANLYAQADWRFAERASATLGVRTTRVRFESRDYFIVGANPDDSGSVTYSSTSPVAGLTYRITPEMNLYASAGNGFETPTIAELAYSPAGPGLNLGLKASRSSNTEIGIKGRIADYQRLTLAYFESLTRDEIVVDTSVGGRTTYKNASRTRRSGWELSWQAVLPAGFDAQVAYTLLDARFDEAYASGSPPLTVPAGKRLPGVPANSLYAQLQWRHYGSGFAAALEARHSGNVYVDDRNSDSAAAYTVANLRAGFEQAARGWRLSETLRVDNFTDKNYVGSVIVAESNSRYFEPAPRRGVSVIVSARLAF